MPRTLPHCASIINQHPGSRICLLTAPRVRVHLCTDRTGWDDYTRNDRPARSVLKPVHLYWTDFGKVLFGGTNCGLLAARPRLPCDVTKLCNLPNGFVKADGFPTHRRAAFVITCSPLS